MSYNCKDLNGNWLLAPGTEKPTAFPHSIPVPSLVDCATPLFDWQKHDYYWYKTTFEINQNQPKQHIFLQLEQVQFGAQVWLNGQLIGEDIPCYTSQWFELTNFVKSGQENELLVRVGQKHTLPPHSAVGNDQERLAWFPGIWGDVKLHTFGSGRVSWLRAIPNLEEGSIAVTTEIENLSLELQTFSAQFEVLERKSGRLVCELKEQVRNLGGKKIDELEHEFKIPEFVLWEPEHPFLYEIKVKLVDKAGHVSHDFTQTFGMRSFEIRDGHFFLNGHRRVLLGSNIAFHRLLADPQRGTLLWDDAWIKKVLVNIPKENNLFFFRFHIGHAYNKWYEFADEYGIMLEDEWAFWTSSGTPEQTEKEFRSWLRENGHHASIMIWNALNESSDTIITGDIIPRLKKELDPTRPWQHVDFAEDHPYIYSLGPVLNSTRFGFARSIDDLKNSATPSMVNEYLWWWLDYQGQASELTQIAAERWLGRNFGMKEMLAHQAFLARELGELWRRLDLDAIMPFVYLSVGFGPTANWFFEPLSDLKPKPVLAALKSTFSPVGVSLALWDRHFVCGETRTLQIYLFNDSTEDAPITLRLFDSSYPNEFDFQKQVSLKRNERQIITAEHAFSQTPGTYQLCAEIVDIDGQVIANSEKIAHVLPDFKVPTPAKFPRIALADSTKEIPAYLKNNSIPFTDFPCELNNKDVVVLSGQTSWKLSDESIHSLSRFVENGGTLLLQEPEFGVTVERHIRVLEKLKLKLEFRHDPETGGYDSYIFAENPDDALWHDISPEHLKMFNGGFGGEVVSQHHVMPDRDFVTHARCGLSLCIPAVMEMAYGKGRVVISRVQVRGRLLKSTLSGGEFDRRYDPVSERYFCNLLKWCGEPRKMI